MSGSSTGDETNSDDVSLNDLSVNHNNNLFQGTVAETCVDALAHMELAAESLTTEDLDPSKPKINEDQQFLLGNNSGYHAPEDSSNLWNKAITTLAKGKCNSKDKGRAENEEPKRLSAYDMSHLIDGSINGGQAPSIKDEKKKKKTEVVPSSEFSIDGESAILWGDDPEKAYFAYMLEQEAEHRAMEGKDQDDSLMAESARQELMNGLGGGVSSFEEDDTTLGNPSKVLGGWDPSTVGAGPSVQISTLTPSYQNQGSSQQRDKDGHLIIPNVIYVQDGTDPDPKVQPRTWNGKNDKTKASDTKQKPEQALPPTPRKSGNKSKAATKQLDHGRDGNVVEDLQRPKSGWYANRLMIGAALFFLVLTTGLVAALIVYRNHYVEEEATSPPIATTTANGNNLDANDDFPIVPPLAAPVPDFTNAPSPSPSSLYPTTSLFKKQDDDEGGEDNEGEFVVPESTQQPTWMPTELPTWSPTGKKLIPVPAVTFSSL